MSLLLPLVNTLSRNTSRNLFSYSKWKHLRCMQRCSFSESRQLYGVYEPDDLSSGAEIPEYDSVHIRMKGYDFVVLETFAKYVHKMGKAMEFETDSFAVPFTSCNVNTYKPNTSSVQNTFSLKLYERVVELQDVPSTKLPAFIELLRMHTPEGIQVTVREPREEDEEYRYIPDKEKETLEAQLEELGGSRKLKKK
ncbi:hypothetical protein ACJMK2_037598 [Sinanodonta woodiana]|uniref:Small ribosomal subunit protein uS10 domain-containing protein n=1 Tax=Sinanodonta woodiana TaxID=1069815 RepID=A0ABD3WKZ3_SINWO